MASDDPTEPPTSAPTAICPELLVNVLDDRALFNKSEIDGLYVLLPKKSMFGRPVFEAPQSPNDRTIEFSGSISSGYWTINAKDAGSLTMGPTDLQSPPYGTTSTEYNWEHNALNGEIFHLSIECVSSFGPISTTTISTTENVDRSQNKDHSETITIIVIIAISALIVILIVFTVVYFKHFKRNNHKKGEEGVYRAEIEMNDKKEGIEPGVTRNDQDILDKVNETHGNIENDHDVIQEINQTQLEGF